MQIKFEVEDPSVVDHFPVKPAKKVLPEWYKDLEMSRQIKMSQDTVPTIKHCIPVTDILTSGYIIENTYEIKLNPKIRETGGYTANHVECPKEGYIKEHHWEQCPVGNKTHWMKITQPWTVKTPPGYSCLFIQPFYQFQEWRLFPAIVDTDKHDVPVELPGYIPSGQEISIMPGTPLVQVIPFKRDEWTMEMEVKPYSSKAWFHLAKIGDAFYRKFFHSKKSFN
jgi:hypothetical protein